MKNSDMPAKEMVERFLAGDMSRRQFTQLLGAAGISLVAQPVLSGRARAEADGPGNLFHLGWL